MPPSPSLTELAQDLAAGRTTARALLEDCIDKIEALGGEGPVAFVGTDFSRARASADHADGQRRAGRAQTPYAGIPVSVKDLFDVARQRTRAGSRALDDRPAALTDAPSVARLRGAGFVVIGRTNMTEFAFSGLGLNPHFGTPRTPWRRDEEGRIAGGSSSGAAVSVSDGMAHAALGTDTGGSCRIPAAFTGLVGFKPTAARISRDGVIPLSPTLDGVGTLARSVQCATILDGVLADDGQRGASATPAGPVRLAAVANYVLEGMDGAVAASYEGALMRLSGAGFEVVRVAVAAFDRIPEINAKGGFPAVEAYRWHRDLIQSKAGLYDPRVATRILRGQSQSAADYAELQLARRRLIEDVGAAVAGFDAMVFPTVPIVPPRVDELQDDAAFTRINLLALRNSTVVNMIDGCAISLPMGPPEGPPAGLTVAATNGADHRLLAIAAAIEAALLPLVSA